MWKHFRTKFEIKKNVFFVILLFVVFEIVFVLALGLEIVVSIS